MSKVNSAAPARYAVIQTGGKQYIVTPGKTVAIEKLSGNLGESVTFSEVLFRKSSDASFEVGAPFVSGAAVSGTIVKHDKEAKVVVFKFKRRKKHRTKRGHRQPFTVVRIEAI